MKKQRNTGILKAKTARFISLTIGLCMCPDSGLQKLLNFFSVQKRGQSAWFCTSVINTKMQICRLRVTHVMSAGLGQASEEEGIREVANMVRDAIKMTKKADEVEAILKAKEGTRNVRVADTGSKGDLFVELKMISWRRVLDMNMEVENQKKSIFGFSDFRLRF